VGRPLDGNAAFPSSTQVVASRQTADSMTDLDLEKRARAENLFGNLDAIRDVTELDLGGRRVELWHFGPGNSPGDTVVRVPEARAAWTGNLLSNQRALTMLLEVPPGPYIDHHRPLQERPGRPDHRPRSRPLCQPAGARPADGLSALAARAGPGRAGARRTGSRAAMTHKAPR
jgi:hypothetical protein